MTDQIPHILPLRGASNFAPTKPLRDLIDKTTLTSHYLTDAVVERYKHFMAQNERVFQEHANVGQLIDLFIQGKQRLFRSPHGGEWVIRPIKKETSENQGAISLMRFYETNCVAKWCMSNPDVRVIAGSDSDKSQVAAKGATAIVDHYEEKFYYDDVFDIRQGKLALRFGTYINCIRPDIGRAGITILRDIFEDKMVRAGDGWARCGDCQHADTAISFGYPESNEIPELGVDYTCPNCKSNSVLPEPPAQEIINSFSRTEQQQIADLTCTEWPLPSVRWDLAYRPEESSWLIHSERTTLSAIRSILGDIRLKGDAGHFGLDIMDALATAGQAISGRSDHGNERKSYYKDPVTVSEFWMEAQDYADIKLQGDEETVSGGSYEKGAKLTDLFPDNLCAVLLNGKHLIGLYGESHKEYIVSGTWHMNPLSGAGSGIGDTVEAQKRRNKYDAQNMDYWEANATPAILYEKNMITSDYAKALDHPKGAIPVDLASLPAELKSLDKAIKQLPPGSPSAGFLDYTYNHLNSMMQLTSHNVDFSSGLPDVNNKTATGARILAANSNSLYTPPLQVKAYTRKRGGKLVVAQFKKYMPVKRAFSLGGKFGKQQWIELSGQDITDDLVYTVTRDSEYPRNPLAKQEEATTFYTLFGGFPNYIAAKKELPQEVGALERLFNIETEGESYSSVETLCLKRFEQMKQVAQVAPNPQIIAQAVQPTISFREPNLELKAKFFGELLDDDILQDAPPQLREAVEMIIDEHISLATTKQSILNAAAGVAQLAGQAPQLAVQGMQQDMQNQRQDEQNQLTQGQQESERAGQSQDAQAARDHEMNKMGVEHQNNLELARINQKAKAA